MKRAEAALCLLALGLIFCVPPPARAASVGLIPAVFPRDPAGSLTYPEQMAISQILEPLVSSDQFGNVVSAIADKWEISDHGRTLRFHVRRNIVFSDGTPLTSADVVSSLQRHWKNKLSNSYSLLDNMSRISAVDGLTVDIRLYRPQVAFIKILTWDHFGITPAKWRFSKDSAEPFIGTGPYRLVRSGTGWSFVKNERHRDTTAVTIPKWDVVFVPPSISDLDKIPALPDYAPALRGPILDLLKRNPRFDASIYQVRPRFGYSQMLAWWNPHAAAYQSPLDRRIKMGAIRMLLNRRRSALKLPAAYGLIPQGVAGHMVGTVPFPDLRLSDVQAAAESSPKIKTIRVGVPARLKDDVFEPEDVAAIEKMLGVRFEVVIRQDFNSSPSNADIVINIWSGSFNDPEGFIPIITGMMSMPLKQYLAALWPLYLSASAELNWTKRSDLFRKFDHALVAGEWLVPAWKAEYFTLLKKDLTEAEAGYRYTPKLLEVRRQ